MPRRKLRAGEGSGPSTPRARDAQGSELALRIPPPRDRTSAIRRHDLATSWAEELGELAAQLVSEGKLDAAEAGPRRPKGGKK